VIYSSVYNNDQVVLYTAYHSMCICAADISAGG